MLVPRLEGVDRSEVLRYLGCRGSVPPEQEALLCSCEEELRATARPRIVYRVFPVREGKLGGTALTLEGEDIRRHLEGCSQAVLMAATLGAEAETILLRAEVSDLARALVLDSVESAAIEQVCDLLEADLRREFETRGLFLTGRYSPGYGDFPLRLQGPLCEVLDARRRIGLSVSGSGILIPRKSVTAVLGVSERPLVRRRAGCEECSLFATCDHKKCAGLRPEAAGFRQ